MLGDKLKECVNSASLAWQSSIIAQMKGRIHQDGEKTDGNKIGDYSLVYGKYRKSRGRQTDKVDLHLEGNLENSFSQGEIDGRFVVGFDSKEEYDIAQKHTSHYGNIWTPSEEEQLEARKQFGKIYQQCLSKLFRK